MGEIENPTFLGFDLSTQQLKAVVVDNDLRVLCETNVQFDSDLPEFRTNGGFLQTKSEPNVATVPTLMWVKALDMILDRLRICGVDFGKVLAISGAAQQHGTVYWAKGSQKMLQNLNPEKFLHEQLASCFSVTAAPIWRDCSTKSECKILEDAVGGPEKLAKITGSRAYERFPGSQIAKIARKKSDAYESTERISLVSSFAASLFLGDYAPIDWADGSGMNLLDIHEKDWVKELLEACAPNLKDKLGSPVPSCTVVGNISQYFVERFGFDAGCRVVAFTGDNPASMAGLKLREGDIGCSLGTSDTLFLYLKEPKTVIDGHVLCNPIDEDAYMALLTFKNASLTRERIRNTSADSNWHVFNDLLNNTPRGNFGNFGLYYDAQEILPAIQGEYRYNKDGERITRYKSKEVEVRALVEGQFVAKKAYVEDFGLVTGPNTRIIATGGASMNKNILQVIADVFNSPVYVSEIANSAMIGSTYRAKHAISKTHVDYEKILSTLPEMKLACKPYDDAEKIYKPMVARYRKIVEDLMVGK